MWNISSNDVEHAKDAIKFRRAEVETRYAKEKEMLDAEFATMETPERAASEFAPNHGREQVQAVPEDTAPVEMGISDGTEEKDPLALAPASRQPILRVRRRNRQRYVRSAVESRATRGLGTEH